ncbi:MAG: acyl-CoA desaturase [Flavobacteriia bacterium]|nr:acyl-CoA desaturase [Flavobacteriia bacterium]
MNQKFNAPLFVKSPNQAFYKTLNQRVTAYFNEKNISRHANFGMVTKTLFMMVLYFTPLVVSLFVTNHSIFVLLWILAGLGMAGLGLSVMHDANHGAYSNSQKINYFVGGIMCFIGGNSTNWKIQHNLLHHTFTNIDGYDEDIDAPVSLLRFSPYTAWKPIHKYQHLYVWFFYSLMTIMWFLTKDFKQAKRYHQMDLLKTQGLTYKKHLLRIIAGKVFYAVLILALPLYFSQVAWPWVILSFVLMQMVAGLILSLVFQPAHVVPDTSFAQPSVSGDVEADSRVHQLYTTANFSMKSRWFTWFVGGLNFQVEHHLFPNICHVHYRALSKIVKKTAEEFNLPYHTNKTFVSALRAHTKMLKMLGQKDCPDFVHV